VSKNFFKLYKLVLDGASLFISFKCVSLIVTWLCRCAPVLLFRGSGCGNKWSPLWTGGWCCLIRLPFHVPQSYTGCGNKWSPFWIWTFLPILCFISQILFCNVWLIIFLHFLCLFSDFVGHGWCSQTSFSLLASTFNSLYLLVSYTFSRSLCYCVLRFKPVGCFKWLVSKFLPFLTIWILFLT